MNVKCKSFYPSENRAEMMSSFSKQKPSVQFSKKRTTSEIKEGEKKRLKRMMDPFAAQQCSVILKALMTHPAGWVFNQPVDPVALNIPDYFSIISDPMDLATIKSKLKKNKYVGTDHFADDVRLTFRNAVLYNPPSNCVHKMAYELSEVFEKKWKLLEEKWFERSNSGQGKLSCEKAKGFDDTRDENRSKQCLPSKSCSSERKIIKLSLKPVVAEQADVLKTKISCANKSTVKNFYEGTDTARIHACDTLKEKELPKQFSQKSRTFNSQCSFSSDLTNVFRERPLIKDSLDSVNSCKLASDAKFLSNSQISKSDSDSQVVDGVLDSEDVCPSNHLLLPAVDALSDGWRTSVSEIQLSPKKALRAAMLKIRFTDTILKAQQKMLLNNGQKIDPMKMQQEKMEMERRQREEKDRIEARIKVEEAAKRTKTEAKLKQQRENEREAARVAIRMMEKTVQLDQNLMFLRELEKISGVTIPIQTLRNTLPLCKAEQPRTPLERLGLYLKDEFDEFLDEEEHI